MYECLLQVTISWSELDVRTLSWALTTMTDIKSVSKKPNPQMFMVNPG